MKKQIALLVGLIVSTLAPCSSVAAPQDEAFKQIWNETHAFWKTTAEEAGVVGSSLMVLHDGEILASETYGMADVETARIVDERTIYHWASITKTFTGIAIMQLRDLDLLDLEDPIVEYVPELRDAHNPFGDMRGITLRHLMSHASGMRGATWPWSSQEWHPHEPTEWEQLVAMFPYSEILFQPGSRYSYSNPGVILLGRVIELLTGEDYEVYVDKNVLSPLGMHDSYFDHTPYHLLERRSNNYYSVNGELTPNGLDFDTGITVSNGGLNAPITDMAKYLAFLSGIHQDGDPVHQDGDPVHQDGDPGFRVLARSSLEEMWQIQQPISADANGNWSMGLSFFLYDGIGERIIGHTGGQMGFRSFIYVCPNSGAAAVLAFNTIVQERLPDGNIVNNDTGFLEIRRKIFEDVFPLLR